MTKLTQSLILAPKFDRIEAIPTVSELLHRHATTAPDRVAMRFEGRDLSYLDLKIGVTVAAAALNGEGIEAGDRICYIGKNSDAYFILLYACAQVGAVMVPIGWRLAAAEMAYMVDNSGASLLFADADFAPTARTVAGMARQQVRVIATEGAAGSFLDAWMGNAPQGECQHKDNPDTPFIQLYTSGTTGRPKGVSLSPRNFFGMRLRCRAAGVDWDQWSPDDVAMVAMPVAHVGGSGYGLMTLFHGATALIAREFTPDGLLDGIRNEKVSKFFIVPTALQIMIRALHAREVDYSRIRHILYGASPMPLPLLQEAMDVIGAGLCQQYGMTETTGTIVALPPSDHDPAGNQRMKSAGKPLPGVDLKIVDDAGNVVPIGSVGEIMVRSDANMTGYWNLPDATAATVDPDGWLRTGDAAWLDADGYVYICDRLKDMICSGGENVYAAEVEAVLFGHPDIGEAAVIGVPDDKWGEAVKAIVVAREGKRIDPASVIAWSRDYLAGYKIPKSVDVVSALPKNANGKTLKHELRKPYWESRDRKVN